MRRHRRTTTVSGSLPHLVPHGPVGFPSAIHLYSSVLLRDVVTVAAVATAMRPAMIVSVVAHISSARQMAR
eukprot:1265576-Pyramimonas_sp.AAC.1